MSFAERPSDATLPDLVAPFSWLLQGAFLRDSVIGCVCNIQRDLRAFFLNGAHMMGTFKLMEACTN